MLLFDFHDFDSDTFFFNESDRQVFVAYSRTEDHLLAFQFFFQRRNRIGDVSLFLYQFGQQLPSSNFRNSMRFGLLAYSLSTIHSGLR